MKEVKYIPGDLVMYGSKVTTVRECRGNYYVLNCQKPIEDAVYRTDLMPIPITLEFLEKNGWTKYKRIIDAEDGYEYYIYVNKSHSLRIYHYIYEGEFSAFICGHGILSKMKYIYQLQHLLFGLGLSSDLKVTRYEWNRH